MATAVGTEVCQQEDVNALDRTLERAKTGDDDAFRELVETVSPEFTRLLLRKLCRDADSTSSVLQDAWLSAWQRLPMFASATTLRQWVYRVASNDAISRLRHGIVERKAHSKLASGFYPPALRFAAFEIDPHDEAESSLIRAAIERLPERFRPATALFYLHDRSHEEIASLLGLSSSAIKMRLHRVRVLLRGRLRTAADPLRTPATRNEAARR